MSSHMESWRLPHITGASRHALKPLTYAAYYRAVLHFLRDCRLTSTELRRCGAHSVDRKFTAWLDARFAAGTPRSIGECALNGLHYFLPRLKGKLPYAQRTLRGWRRSVIVESYPPMPLNVATLLAIRLAAHGHILPALAVLLSFDCYLRINECMRLKVGDVRIPSDDRLGPRYLHCAIHLRSTKTLDNLSCTIHDPMIARLLHRCIINRHRSESIFPFSASVFRELHFKRTLRELRLSHLGFTPHSLRHGGATHDFVIAGRDETYVTKRGRWASAGSAHRYMQTLAAVDLTFAVPHQLDSDGALFRRQLEVVMDAAVSNRWSRLPQLTSTERAARSQL